MTTALTSFTHLVTRADDKSTVTQHPLLDEATVFVLQHVPFDMQHLNIDR